MAECGKGYVKTPICNRAGESLPSAAVFDPCVARSWVVAIQSHRRVRKPEKIVLFLKTLIVFSHGLGGKPPVGF